MAANYTECRNFPMSHYTVTVYVSRHDALMCRPGMYRIVFGLDGGPFHPGNKDAVMDDFGNLVAVSGGALWT